MADRSWISLLESEGAVEPERSGPPTGVGEVPKGAPPDACPSLSDERAGVRALVTGIPHRRLWCRFYWRCVDHAILHRWQGFSCAVCPVEDELSAEEKATMYESMGRALRARLREAA